MHKQGCSRPLLATLLPNQGCSRAGGRTAPARGCVMATVMQHSDAAVSHSPNLLLTAPHTPAVSQRRCAQARTMLEGAVAF